MSPIVHRRLRSWRVARMRRVVFPGCQTISKGWIPDASIEKSQYAIGFEAYFEVISPPFLKYLLVRRINLRESISAIQEIGHVCLINDADAIVNIIEKASQQRHIFLKVGKVVYTSCENGLDFFLSHIAY